MSNRKKIVLIIIGIIILTGLSIALFKLLKGENKSYGDITDTATTTLEDREKWNEFLQKNPYISEMGEGFLDDTDIIKTAISSENVELEYITTEEIDEMSELSLGEGYKKSINNINEFAKKTFNIDEVSYNFVDTYIDEESYLLIGNEYVYFTKIDLPERVYVLVNLDTEENNYKAEIYEYEINENNSTEVNEMLENGKINKSINISKKYTITGTMENEGICVLNKIYN